MNRLAALRFHTLHIPFRQRFSHASASRDATSSLWVEALGTDGRTGYGEACPRPYVTGETLDTARGFFAAVRDEVMAEIRDAATLRAWVDENAARINLHPSAWSRDRAGADRPFRAPGRAERRSLAWAVGNGGRLPILSRAG